MHFWPEGCRLPTLVPPCLKKHSESVLLDAPLDAPMVDEFSQPQNGRFSYSLIESLYIVFAATEEK